MKILALGDPHGYWRLAAATVRAWKDAHGRWPNAVLCVGDMGYFPEPSRIDRATRRHAEADPDQIEGMRRLLAGYDRVVVRLLQAGDAPPIDCVAGNHEDHGLLLRRVDEPGMQGLDRVPLDPRGHVRVIRDGEVVEYALPDGGSPLRVAGLWGVQAGENRKRPLQPGRNLNPELIAALARTDFDLLLTHEAPRTDVIPTRYPASGAGAVGSEALRTLLEQKAGVLHLFGHYHHAEGAHFVVGRSEARLLSILRPFRPGMALEISGGRGAWQVRRWVEVADWAAALHERAAELGLEAKRSASEPAVIPAPLSPAPGRRGR
jgi:hypothetical protein